MVLRSYYSGKIIPGNPGKNPPISQLDSWPRRWLLLPVFAMFIFRGASAVQWPDYEADWQNAANIQCGGGYTRDGFSGQHLITATIWCLNTVLWLVRRAILGSDWLICCNDDGHQSMPRVRSVRISKNMIITLSTGLGIYPDREDSKIWKKYSKSLILMIWKGMKLPVLINKC